MKKELQDKLFKKYPKIFRQKDMPMQETAMCWGISCGDGWYDLIDDLCGEIQNRVDNVNRSSRYKMENSPKTLVPTKIKTLTCEATQVKEKFGGLRFYVDCDDDYIDGIISLAEAISLRTCSECGGRATRNTKARGWVHAICQSCRGKENESR